MRFAAVVIVACLAGLAPAAHATVVALTSLEEMTHRSDVVMQAVVVDQQVVEERQGKIVTLTTMKVIDGISGVKANDLVTVYQIGGLLGDRQSWIAGAHKFTVGEEMVFFGSKLKNGRVVPWAIGYGLFSILDDVDGRHVKEIAGDVAALERTADGGSRMVQVKPREFTSLDEFKAHLRTILAGENAPALPTLRIERPVRSSTVTR